ncbi:MAG: nucleotide pyrophosphohydrolase [Candidatus Aegiribacteria sp.]|nr:nucleotide pyrophosphohydrolase [Candidatus Aegiribacteria sp.]
MLDRLREKILEFRDLRDWKQFHDPKNLAEAISIESAELLENFLWKTSDESRNLNEKQKKAIGEEIADIAIFLTILAHEMKLDIEQIVNRKLDLNEAKYPVNKSKGSAAKYTEF